MKNKPLGKEKLKKKLLEKGPKDLTFGKGRSQPKKPLAKGKGVKTDKSELNKDIRCTSCVKVGRGKETEQ